MIDDAEVERVRAIAYESRYKSGTLGVWGRRYLELHEFMLAAITKAEDQKNHALNG